MNFGLWAISILPAWLVIRHFGAGQEKSGSDISPDTEAAAEETLKSRRTASKLVFTLLLQGQDTPRV